MVRFCLCLGFVAFVCFISSPGLMSYFWSGIVGCGLCAPEAPVVLGTYVIALSSDVSVLFVLALFMFSLCEVP